MEIKAKDFSYLIGRVNLSEELLRNHFKLYEGYVANTNTLLKEISELKASSKELTPLYAELKRRFAWEWNGVRLHELYFENLGGDGSTTLAPRVVDIIKANFGTYDAWKEDFVATAKMRGIGWVVTYYDPQTSSIYNTWVNEHNENHLAGLKPVLVLDVFEHAFMLDFGLNRADYIEVFFSSIDWQAVESRI